MHSSFKNVTFLFLAVIASICLSRCRTADEKSDNPTGLYLPNDLEATLWAESPMLYNPTNLDVDARGRLWVTEAVNYRSFVNDSLKFLHHLKGDRVMILEDTDHDGKADTAKLFVADKDLVSPLGIAVIGNKVYVSCSPNLIVYTDENGDDVPDKKEIFLTGFGGKDHDHSLHSVVGGPDGNLYFNTGNAGPHLVKDKSGWMLRSGSIYDGDVYVGKTNHGNMTSDDGKVWVGGLALRINPDGKMLKVMGHNFRNSYEVNIDSYGNLWQNDNDDEIVACRTSWLMEGGNAGYFSNDGTRYWRADQRPWQDVFVAHWHQDDPGIMPVGNRTGAGAPTGVATIEGDELGERYRGTLLSADAGRNVIFGFHPKPEESGFDLGKRENMITSLPFDHADYVWNDSAANAKKDQWFRPSDVAVGTDGALYVADWYDGVVGGHQMQDRIGYGRIYRITPKGKKLQSPDLKFESVDDLIKAFQSPAINVRYRALEGLKASGNRAVKPVKELLGSSNPYYRARATWLLAQLGDEGKTKVENLLSDKDPLIRSAAFRALRQTESDILPFAEKLSTDTSAFVRREVAVALRDLPFGKTKNILIAIAKQYDGKDKWYLAALTPAIAGHEEEFYRDCQKIFNKENKGPDQWSEPMASIAFGVHPPSATKDLRARASAAGLSEEARSNALTALAFINTKDAVTAMLSLTHSNLKDVAEKAAYWVSFRQGNEWFGLYDWSKSDIDPVRQRKFDAMKVYQRKILDATVPLAEKKRNAAAMAEDPIGGQMLIVLVSEKKLPSDLHQIVEDHIFRNSDLAVRLQASNYFKHAGKAYSLDSVKLLTGDRLAGEKLFAAKCVTCHRVNKTGSDTGPELTQIGKKFGRDQLLDAIINPNAAIEFGYEPWLVTTESGESYFGFIVADSKQNIVVKDLLGKRNVIATASITSRKKQDKSLMPEPASLGLTNQNLSDLSAYLMTLGK